MRGSSDQAGYTCIHPPQSKTNPRSVSHNHCFSAQEFKLLFTINFNVVVLRWVSIFIKSLARCCIESMLLIFVF